MLGLVALMMAIGLTHLNDCPVNSLIPIYLVSFDCVRKLFTIFNCSFDNAQLSVDNRKIPQKMGSTIESRSRLDTGRPRFASGATKFFRILKRNRAKQLNQVVNHPPR